MKKKLIIIGVSVLILISVFILFNNFRTYTVTFDSKMGTSIEAQQVKKGELVINPNVPVMDGYEFVGWYLDDSEYDFNNPVNKNITLVGKWKKIN